MAKNILRIVHKIARIIFNLTNVAHFAFIIYFANSVRIPGIFDTYGGRWKFLTNWNLHLQLAYFTVGICNELFGSQKTPSNIHQSSKLQKLRDFLFSTLAFPVAMFVTISFWSLYSIDRNLIFPTQLDKFYPLWANHMLHTTCLISQMIEMNTSYHIYPSRTKGCLTIIGFSLIYLGWILFIAHNANIWVYPVLEKLPAMGRILFLGGCSVASALLFLGGEFVNRKLWALGEKQTKGKSKAVNGDEPPPPSHSYNTRSRKKVAKAD